MRNSAGMGRFGVMLAFVLCLAASAARAETVAWEKVVIAPTTSYAKSVAVDDNDAVYAVTGPLNAEKVRKYSAAGAQFWARTVKGATGIATFANSAVYVTGTRGTGMARRLFLAKYSAGGVLAWERYYRGTTGTLTTWGEEVAVDAAGNAHVLGTVSGAVVRDVLVLKYSPDGSRQWACTWALSAGGFFPGGIAVDSDGSSYVAGAEISSYVSKPVIGKVNVAGQMLWSRTLPADATKHWSWLGDVALSADGFLFAVGTEYRVGRGADGCIYKIGSLTGGLAWKRNLGSAGSGDEQLRGVAVGPSGNVFVTGDVPGSGTDAYLGKYSGATGARLWSTRRAGAAPVGIDYGTKVAVKGDALVENIYVVGAFTRGGQAYPDSWVAKYH